MGDSRPSKPLETSPTETDPVPSRHIPPKQITNTLQASNFHEKWPRQRPKTPQWPEGVDNPGRDPGTRRQSRTYVDGDLIALSTLIEIKRLAFGVSYSAFVLLFPVRFLFISDDGDDFDTSKWKILMSNVSGDS